MSENKGSEKENRVPVGFSSESEIEEMKEQNGQKSRRG